MYRQFLLLVFLGDVFGVPSVASEATDRDNFTAHENEASPGEIISDSGSKSRQTATGERKKKALKSQFAHDAKTEIVHRLDAASLLKPQRVRLIYQDTPLLEALADFNKGFGCNVVLHDPDKSLASRRLTLDTGKATFWEALDRVCTKAGLVEVETPPTTESRSAHWVARFSIGRAKKRAVDPDRPPQNCSSEPIMLQALQKGDRPVLAASYVGPFRLRILPLSENQKKDPEITLSVELAAQPGLGIAKMMKWHVDKSVDDQGQNLQPSSDRVIEVDSSLDDLHRMQQGLGKTFEAFAGVGKVVVNVNEIHDEKYRNFAIQFHKGGKRSRSLKEMTGTLSALVMPPAEAFVCVPDVFQKAGRLVEGEQGSRLKVLDAVRHPDGRLRLHIELTAHDMTVQGALAKLPQNFTYYLLGPLGQLNMEDEKNVLPPESYYVEEQNSKKPNVAELWVTFRPAAGRRPTKLVFSGRRCVTLQIPFEVKNVPLK